MDVQEVADTLVLEELDQVGGLGLRCRVGTAVAVVVGVVRGVDVGDGDVVVLGEIEQDVEVEIGRASCRERVCSVV